MLKLKFRKIKEAQRLLKKLPRFLAERAFLTSLILIFIALIFGGLIFYKYSFLVEKRGPEVLEKPLFLNEKTLQEILKIWQEKERKFKEADLKEYPNPFSID